MSPTGMGPDPAAPPGAKMRKRKRKIKASEGIREKVYGLSYPAIL